MKKLKLEYKPKFKPEFKPEPIIIGQPSEKRLEEIKKWFAKTVIEACRPRCPFCGAKLSNYWFYEPHGFKCLQQFQICLKCKKKVVKK